MLHKRARTGKKTLQFIFLAIRLQVLPLESYGDVGDLGGSKLASAKNI
jgi:hypothetical protein